MSSALHPSSFIFQLLSLGLDQVRVEASGGPNTQRQELLPDGRGGLLCSKLGHACDQGTSDQGPPPIFGRHFDLIASLAKKLLLVLSGHSSQRRRHPAQMPIQDLIHICTASALQGQTTLERCILSRSRQATLDTGAKGSVALSDSLSLDYLGLFVFLGHRVRPSNQEVSVPLGSRKKATETERGRLKYDSQRHR